MSEQPIHTNPWAEKLQEVSLPEAAEAKEKMLLLLEREMPLPPKKDRRRWIILILLLLLLLGVCHCPGLVHVGKPATMRPSGGVAGITKGPVNKDAAITTARKSRDEETSPALTQANKTFIHGTFSSNEINRQAHIAYTMPVLSKQARRHTTRLKKQHNDGVAATVLEEEEKAIEPGSTTTTGKRTGKTNEITPVDSASRVAKTPPGIDTACIINSNSSDSAAKKKVQDKHKKWWALGTGINQSFPIGGGKVHINADDYIPVLQLQYHFNQKWYVQTEAAVHSPQYTPPLLLQQGHDTLGTVNNSITLEKLYYLQVPLGVYYSPFRNCYTGAGIRYGILTNATALYLHRFTLSGTPDSTRSVTQSLKKNTDSLYHAIKATDLQWFADINYQVGHFLLGMRYNRSIGNFINLRVSPIQTTTAANQSLQLYLRYSIWRQRSKKKLPVK